MTTQTQKSGLIISGVLAFLSLCVVLVVNFEAKAKVEILAGCSKTTLVYYSTASRKTYPIYDCPAEDESIIKTNQ